MNTVVLIPTEDEAAPIRAARPFADVRVCGVGMAAAGAFTASLLVGERPDRILLCGIAGAYDLDSAPDRSSPWVWSGSPGLPENTPTGTKARRSRMAAAVVSNTVSRSGAEADGAAVENMEGAAVMAVCHALGVACSEIRAVSNRVGDPFDRWQIPEALDSLVAALVRLAEEHRP